MELTIILTSWNRPTLVIFAIESILSQTSDRWRLIIQDDDSRRPLLEKLRGYAKHPRISLRQHTVRNRTAKTRYSVLINEVLPKVETEIVGYMCDNVEYKPEMVDSVLAFFEQRQDAKAGYIYHERDVWTTDGPRQLGPAALYGQPNHLPTNIRSYKDPLYNLDHSQVFHRLPVKARWNESREVVRFGDGVFFTELVKETGPIEPIRPGYVLSLEHLLYESLYQPTS